MLLGVLTCAGTILRHGQKNGAGCTGRTGKPFDAPMAQKRPARPNE